MFYLWIKMSLSFCDTNPVTLADLGKAATEHKDNNTLFFQKQKHKELVKNLHKCLYNALSHNLEKIPQAQTFLLQLQVTIFESTYDPFMNPIEYFQQVKSVLDTFYEHNRSLTHTIMLRKQQSIFAYELELWNNGFSNVIQFTENKKELLEYFIRSLVKH